MTATVENVGLRAAGEHCPAKPCPVPQLEESLAPVLHLGTALPALDAAAIEAQRAAMLVELAVEQFRTSIPHVCVPDRSEMLVSWSLEAAAANARRVADAHLRRCGHPVAATGRVPARVTPARSGGTA
jgi:hypothetical protein